MLRRTRTLATIALAAALMLVTADAAATAQRTFVASYGSPTNTSFNCSITKPCRAFSEAIGVTNPKGEVIVLDSAGYGSATITQSVSIIAPAGIYAGVSVFSGDGITIGAGANDVVVLRGLSINGQGGLRGILFQMGARLRVENCVISGMNSAGIVHNAANGEMIVLDTIVRDNGGTGIYVEGDIVQAVLDHVRSEHNLGAGLYVAPAPGSPGALATVIDSLFTHNAGKGVWAATSSGGTTISIVVEHSAISNNGQDGFALHIGVGATGKATLTRNVLNDNGGIGIWLSATNLTAQISATENSLHRNSGGGVLADGNGMVYLHSNTIFENFVADWACNSANAYISTTGNNNVFTVPTTVGSCLQTIHQN
jgi:hypothetical protein